MRFPTRLAASMTLVLLAGCTLSVVPIAPSPTPAETKAPVVKASPRATTTPDARPTTTGPTTVPGTTATPTPGPNDTPVPTGGPSAQASTPSQANGLVIVSGRVADESGALVDGALVQVTSLNPGTPFQGVASTALGSWVMNNVPRGANVEIKAWKDGWTTRRRVKAFGGPNDVPTDAGTRHELNFGVVSAADGEGAAYFLSDTPEIEGVEATATRIVVRFSEPFADAVQTRLAKAVRVWRGAGPVASDAAAALDLAAVGDVYGTGSADASLRLRPEWDVEGMALTLTPPAGLSAGLPAGAYQLGLASDGAAFEDADGNPFGREATAAGRLIAAAVRLPDLGSFAWSGPAPTPAIGWSMTHDASAAFRVD